VVISVVRGLLEMEVEKRVLGDDIFILPPMTAGYTLTVMAG
jgi:hypothetical protein